MELFYADAGGALVSVRVANSPWSTGPPTPILPPRYFVGVAQSHRTYDIAPNGRRFLMVSKEDGEANSDLLTLVVVQQWSEELARRVTASAPAR